MGKALAIERSFRVEPMGRRAATSQDLSLGKSEVQRKKNRRGMDPVVEPLAREDRKSEHPLVEADVARIDLDDDPVTSFDLVGVDEGRVEQRREDTPRAAGAVDGELDELAKHQSLATQSVEHISETFLRKERLGLVEADRNGAAGNVVVVCSDQRDPTWRGFSEWRAAVATARVHAVDEHVRRAAMAFGVCGPDREQPLSQLIELPG